MNYLFKRLLWAISSIFLVSLVVFGMAKCASEDPVSRLYELPPGMQLQPKEESAFYVEKAALLGISGPNFYFSLRSKAFPDTLYQIFPPHRREYFRVLMARSGKPDRVFDFSRGLHVTAENLRRDTTTRYAALWPRVLQMGLMTDLKQVERLLEENKTAFPEKNLEWEANLAALRDIQAAPNWQNLLTPVLRWHGTENQYHRWISGIFRGDWGTSYMHRRAVWGMLKPRLARTLLLNGLSLLLSVVLALPIGLWLARKNGTRADRWGQAVLIGLHSMPIFWLGGLLVLSFATAYFGMRWFPYGCSSLSGGNAWAWFWENPACLVLPILCLSLVNMSVIALQLRATAVDTSRLPFVRTARAKGLTEQRIWRKHILPNALFPMITLFSSILPGMFGGSVVIEYLFDVPGMGLALFDAYTTQDHPVMFAIVLVTALLTILGLVLTDLAYAWADPRVRLS